MKTPKNMQDGRLFLGVAWSAYFQEPTNFPINHPDVTQHLP